MNGEPVMRKRRQGQQHDRPDTAADRFIDLLGGTVAAAAICGVSAPTVTGWRTAGVPSDWIEFFQAREAAKLAEAGEGVFAALSKSAKAKAGARAVQPDVAALALRLRKALPAVRAVCPPPVASEIAAVAAALLEIVADELRTSTSVEGT